MTAWGKVEKKVARREFVREREQRYLEKRSELDESLEEVFDRQTLMSLYEMLNTKKLKEVRGVVSSGKESRVYHGLGWNGEEYAVKIYLVSSAEFRRNRLQYVVNDPRFKKIPKDFRRFVYLWSEREYSNLFDAFNAGLPVPRPFHQLRNILVMEFLGENGVRLPLLHEEKFELDELEKLYERLVDVLRRMYRDAGMVHGDLSQYNIMVGRGLEVYLIDLAQAVRRDHPLAEKSLHHGVHVLCGFFNKAGLSVDADSTLEMIRRGG
ncbi:MAG: serine protein kinase RIO [Candidatus Caldarchaeum sp.]